MNITKSLMIVAVTVLINSGQESSTVTDIDGNVYHTVKIGNQVWTVENLRTTKYNDGSPIPHITDTAWANDTLGAYCYYNNTTNADSIKKYGALYNWYTVDTKKLAPAGWHVPTDAEWDTLQNYLIANGYNWDNTKEGNKIAKSLAAQTDWETDSEPGVIGNDFTKNNRAGFTALPGGYRIFDGGFVDIGFYGQWWNAKAHGKAGAFLCLLKYNKDYLYRCAFIKSYGYSVRLVKD